MTPIGTAPKGLAIHAVAPTVIAFVFGWIGGELFGESYLSWAHVFIPLVATAIMASLARRYAAVRFKTDSAMISYIRFATFTIGGMGCYDLALPWIALPIISGIALNLWARSDPSRERAVAS